MSASRIVRCIAVAALCCFHLTGRAQDRPNPPIPSQTSSPLSDGQVSVVGAVVFAVSSENRHLIPEGKEVDVIDGDIVLKNSRITAVIARPVGGRDANLTTKNVGGFLLDLTTNRNGSDQLAFVQPQGSGVEYRSFEVSTDSSKSSVTVKTADESQFATYTLFNDAAYLMIETGGVGADSVIDFRIDGGGRVGVSPEGEAEFFWAEDAYWKQAYVVRSAKLGETGQPILTEMSEAKPLRVQRRGRVSTLTVPDDGEADPGKECFLIAPGQTRLHARTKVFPNDPIAQLSLLYQYNAFPIDAEVDVELVRRKGASLESINRFRVPAVPVSGGEAFSVPVPPGPIEIRSSYIDLSSTTARYHLTAGTTVEHRDDLLLGRADSGGQMHKKVSIEIRDGDDWPVPAKVEVREARGAERVNFGPDTGEERVQNLLYVPDGSESVLLPPGSYELRASHGPEYHLASANVEVTNERGASPSLRVQRAYETPGWISADFHSHSSPSGDNISSQRGRVLNLVCEDIDFAPCTEHNRISSYQPHIDELGIGGEMLSCTGIELTGSPLPLNHHNVFPLLHRPFTQNGGGPYVASDPDSQVERLFLWDERADKVIQQNHPDIGWLFRDRNADGEVDDGYSRAIGLIDCIEIHPIESVLELFPGSEELKGQAAKKWNRGRFVAWLQLLNQGRRLPGVVNTDAHYNFHGSGWLRNWIRVPNDEPAECTIESIVEATKAGRIIMSNGPMLEMNAVLPDGSEVGLAEEIRAVDGTVQLRVRVRCADWVHCDRVAILVDGRIEEVFTQETTPDAFGDGVMVFDQAVNLTVSSDAPVLAICGSKSKTLGAVYGLDNATRNFAAATNPIWVNVGDEAWEPSGEDLGQPLAGKRN